MLCGSEAQSFLPTNSSDINSQGREKLRKDMDVCIWFLQL